MFFLIFAIFSSNINFFRKALATSFQVVKEFGLRFLSHLWAFPAKDSKEMHTDVILRDLVRLDHGAQLKEPIKMLNGIFVRGSGKLLPKHHLSILWIKSEVHSGGGEQNFTYELIVLQITKVLK